RWRMSSNPIDLDAFDFALPPEQIAQEPPAQRDGARLLHLDRATGARAHGAIRDLPARLAPGDLLVVNATRVLPARLRGERAEVVLHVGRGTFAPLGDAALRARRLHAERFALPEATARAIRAARERGARVVAVGTTTARVLETCADERGEVAARTGSTELFLA